MFKFNNYEHDAAQLMLDVVYQSQTKTCDTSSKIYSDLNKSNLITDSYESTCHEAVH